MSSITFQDINSKIKKNELLLQSTSDKDFAENLKKLDVSWDTKEVNSESPLYSLFVNNGLVNPVEKKLTTSGILFCSRISIDFESELITKKLLDNKYKIVETISIGKNSCTFLAEHVALGTNVVLKFLRPGSSENIVDSLKL